VPSDIDVDLPNEGEIGTPVQILRACDPAQPGKVSNHVLRLNESGIRNPPNAKFDKVGRLKKVPKYWKWKLDASQPE
jgi:hypothetical protein